MNEWVIVPDWLSDEIDSRLHAVMPSDASKDDYAHCRAQLLSHYDEIGSLPEFGIVKREAES